MSWWTNRASPCAAAPTRVNSPDAESGSATMRRATGPRGLQQSKGYPKRVRSSARSYDTAIQRRLWTLSAELTGVSYG